jgi:hypothetical protein
MAVVGIAGMDNKRNIIKAVNFNKEILYKFECILQNKKYNGLLMAGLCIKVKDCSV